MTSFESEPSIANQARTIIPGDQVLVLQAGYYFDPMRQGPYRRSHTEYLFTFNGGSDWPALCPPDGAQSTQVRVVALGPGEYTDGQQITSSIFDDPSRGRKIIVNEDGHAKQYRDTRLRRALLHRKGLQYKAYDPRPDLVDVVS